MFRWPAQPRRPGLFIAGTDTGVGKTAVTCGIAEVLRGRGGGGTRAAAVQAGICKPFATGCRRSRSGWAGGDIDALRLAAGVRADDGAALARLCPQAFELPASPAAAAAHERRGVDFEAVAKALLGLDGRSDLHLVEGIGGPKVPLDPAQPRYTVSEFAADLGFPVLLVARLGLGTLSHTAMSVESLQAAGCHVVGIVLNDADAARDNDPSAPSNPQWLERLTGIKVLASLARSRDLREGQPCPPAWTDALATVPWAQLAGHPLRVSEPVAW